MSTSDRLLLKFASRYPFLIVINIVLGFSGALFNGVSTALVIPVLLGFIGQGEALFKKTPPILQKIFTAFDVFPEKYRLLAMFGAVVLAIVMKNLTNYASTIASGYLSRDLVNSMRLEALKLLLEVDLDFYSKSRIGDLSNRLNQELGRTAAAIKVAIGMLSTVITVTVFVVFLISISWQLTLIAVILLSLLAKGNQYFVNRSKYFGRILSQKSREYSGKVFEIFTGIRLIKIVGEEQNEYREIEKLIKEREQADYEAQVVSALTGPFNETAGIFTVVLIVFSGHYVYANNAQAFSGIILTYLLFLFRLLPFITQLNSARSKFANTSHSVELSVDFLSRSNKPIMDNGTETFYGLKEGIKLEDLSFTYPGNLELVLNRINLWIPKGKITALVGASGAGKSTIADLLPRLYDPTKGKITLDGVDLRDYALKSIRNAIGVVSQDTFLFNNSVEYNISYGLQDVTEGDIVEAAKRANAYEFIVNLPKKFDTEIGDRGVLLSGGQRQRIAIARALLRNPDILILDEATSALDTVSERLVQEAIDELCQERTTLVIAHRLSTIRKAHQIAVLDRGRIVELGNHEQLLQQNGYYARLYKLQFAKEETVAETAPQILQDVGDREIPGRAFSRLSYEARSHLTALLGSLRLLEDDLIDLPDESNQLLEESYTSALSLLNIIKSFEEKASILLKNY